MSELHCFFIGLFLVGYFIFRLKITWVSTVLVASIDGSFPSGSLQYGSTYDLFWYAISLFQIVCFLKYVFVNEYATWCV